MTLITDASQVTPDWLTKTLRKQGRLDRGQVTTVRKSSSYETPVFSTITHLEPGYSDDAPESAPSRLFCKISKPELKSELLTYIRKEVEFYNTIANKMIDPPVARCYDAVYSPEAGKAHVLLDDLSETHFQPPWPLPPLQVHCEQLVDCLARFHAHWWEHLRFETDTEGPFSLSDNTLQHPYFIDETRKLFPGFVDFMGDRLCAARRRLYEQALSSWPLPRRVERFTARKSLTLIHGDAHVWNFLYPRNPEKDQVCIIDWHEWCISVGTDDLSQTIALAWYPERRARMERALLRRYHDRLLEHGIRDYDWEQCWEDYRTSAISNLFIPIWQWADKLRPAIWWTNLERVILAFQDLECEELLRK